MKGSKALFTALAAVVLGLLVGAVFMLATGSDPIKGYFYLFRGGLMNIERIGNTLASATTLILTGLSVAFAFKTGLFNIGGAGQMLMGGLTATALALTLHLPQPVMILVVCVGALLAGGLWAALPGFLKARFNVHEVVSTIMMNWIAFWIVSYTIPKYFKGPTLETESARIVNEASLKLDWLTAMFKGSYINFGLIVAFIAVVIIALILDRTVMGYELKAVGFNRHAAEYAGISVPRNTVLSMAISGGLAGLAGATYYVGYAVNMQIGVMPTAGFDGIAVALLGANSPWGVLASAVFFGILHSGKGFMNAMTKIPPEIGDTIIATIIYFAATSALFVKLWDSIRKKFRKGA